MKNILLLLFATLFAGPAVSQGVDVGAPSAVRKLVPAAELERQASQEYRQMMGQAAQQGRLASNDDPQLQRLHAIARRILPFAGRFNAQAAQWHWEVNLVRDRQLNAFCMPGGKIAFYSGIIEQLNLTDDEIAIVMGHEVAHALREHARERIAKSQITNGLASIASQVISGTKYGALGQLAIQGGASLTNLKFSRDDESEADVVGLDLAARAGYDPRAGITLWEKMGKASKGAPPAWLSTHPAGRDRIQEIRQHLPEVMPLYEAAHRQ
jgi:predicted Zn-dependent protease